MKKMSERMSKEDVLKYCAEKIKDYLPVSFREAIVEESSYLMERGEVSALSVKFFGEDTELKFNMDQFYESYTQIMESSPHVKNDDVLKDGLNHLANNIVSAFEDTRLMDIPKFSPENYEMIKRKLVITLSGLEGKEQFLKDKPHKVVGTDLVIIYKMELGSSQDDVSRRVTIDNSMVERLRITKEQFCEDALKASMINSPIRITGLFESMLGFEDAATDPFAEDHIIVSTQDSICGAAAFFYPGVQEMIAEKMKESFYVIPSSIHELILIKDSFGVSNESLEKMIREANEIAVAPRDKLSDHAYHYDAKEGLFERADAYEERTRRIEVGDPIGTKDYLL